MSDIAPNALAQLHASFLQSLPLIEGHAHKRFQYLHGDERDEKVAEVVAKAWQAYRRLFERGKDVEGIRGAVAVFCGKSVASGGRLVGDSPVNDVMSPTFRHGHCLGEPREHERAEPSPAEQAIHDADVSAWLATLDERKRQIAEALLAGFDTADVGRMRGVTRTAIWNARQELMASWEEFQGG